MLSKETLDYFIPSIPYYIMLCPVCKKGELVVDPQTMERYCPACGNIAEEKLELSLPNEEITNPHHESTSYALINKGWASIIPDDFFLSGALEAIHADSLLDPVERSFAEAYPMFTAVCGNLRFGASAKEEMGILYRKCAKKGLTRGRERFTMMFALAMITCSDMKLNRDIGALAKEFEVSMALAETYKASVMKMLERERMPMTLWNYIAETLQELGADEKAMKHAGKILQKYLKEKNNRIGRRDPKVVAGVIAYKAMGKAARKTGQKEIAKVLGISERSLRRIQ